eukprot:7385288-Prymnesium_polylepis.2
MVEYSKPGHRTCGARACTVQPVLPSVRCTNHSCNVHPHAARMAPTATGTRDVPATTRLDSPQVFPLPDSLRSQRVDKIVDAICEAGAECHGEHIRHERRDLPGTVGGAARREAGVAGAVHRPAHAQRRDTTPELLGGVDNPKQEQDDGEEGRCESGEVTRANAPWRDA